MKLIDELYTCHNQVLQRGTQVAYCTPTVTNVNRANRYDFSITPGKLRVAHIVQIEEKSAGFAEADGLYELTLDDGAKIWAEEVAVTDGNFRYGTRG
jgi:hypothetical protein